MKKSKLLLLGLVPLLSSCSCSLLSTAPFKWDKYKNDSVAMSLQSSKFKKYKLEDFSSLEQKKENLKEIIVNKGTYRDFASAYTEINGLYIKVINCYIIANTKYYATNTSTDQNNANFYYTTYINLNKFLMGLESDIYHSSDEIKKGYFGNLSDEKIEERINGNQEAMLEADYDKIFSDYQDEGNQLYLKFTQDRNKESFLETGFEYLLRYVNKANELIGQISFDNYLDYSYDYYYNRDYKYSDAMSFVNYVKTYFVPILKNKAKLTKPDNVDDDLYKVIDSYNFCNKQANMCDYFSSYAETMGGEYLTCYNNAFKYGYYCFSDNPNSMGTAYEWNLNGVNDAVLFFSRRYQDVISVTHEFGHYYSCTQNNGVRRGDAYDLQETYSQGNEFTFCKYLLEQKKDDSNFVTYNYFVDDKIYRSVQSLINEAAITEIEKFMYTTPDLTKDSLIEGINDILAGYDGTASETYYMAACLTSPCYYVSYATSLMEALQFAAMSSFDEAKEKYITLVEGVGSKTMVQRWENAGLTSPFEETTFQTLANLFTSVANKY